LQANAAKTENVTLHGELAGLDLGGKAYFVQHFDAPARALAESCRWDVVCYGHDHRHVVERVGEVWLVNPGAVMGWAPGGRGDIDATFVIHDTDADEMRTWVIRGGTAAPGEPGAGPQSG
jgi:predicted phosphodiesterase